MKMFDWFWLGAILNEVEGSREDREQKNRSNRGVIQVEVTNVPASNRKSGNDKRPKMKLPIERMVELERKFQVMVRGATADLETEFGLQVTVRGELTSESGILDEDLRVIATVYNAAGEVIGVGEIQVSARGFVGVEPFELLIPCSSSHGQAVRVRLHVQAG